jgi:hypothetical protein
MYMTPCALGPGGLAWLPLPLVSASHMADVTTRSLGDDILIETYVHRPD